MGTQAQIEAVPYHRNIGLRVESLETDRVRVRLPFKDENSNPGRALHGGVVASTIDIAGSLAALSGFSDAAGLEKGTLDLSVDYLAAAIGEDIVATAEVLRRGKELAYCDVDVRNDAGKRIAKGLVTHRAFDPKSSPAAAGRQRTTAIEPLPARVEVPKGARMFMMVPFIARLGMVVEHAADGYAVLRMPFDPQCADAAEAVHEGALAALIDTAGAMASWSITGLNFTYKASTVGIHASFHAPARRQEVIAHARTLRRNNEIFLNQVAVGGAASGELVAAGSVTYRIVVPD